LSIIRHIQNEQKSNGVGYSNVPAGKEWSLLRESLLGAANSTRNVVKPTIE